MRPRRSNRARAPTSGCTNGKVVHKALLEDKKLHADLQDAVEATPRGVGEAQRGAQAAEAQAAPRAQAADPVRRRRRWRWPLSEKLRSKVLDTLFGAEEEFQYTPPAGGTTTPPATPVTAA